MQERMKAMDGKETVISCGRVSIEPDEEEASSSA